MTQLEKKLKALLAKTVANGATEAEANEAIQLASKIATKYKIDLESINNTEGMIVRTIWSSRSKAHESEYLVYALCLMIGVSVTRRKAYNKKYERRTYKYEVVGYEKTLPCL